MTVLNLYVVLNILVAIFIIYTGAQEESYLSDVPVGDLEFHESHGVSGYVFIWVLFPGAFAIVFAWAIFCLIVNTILGWL